MQWLDTSFHFSFQEKYHQCGCLKGLESNKAYKLIGVVMLHKFLEKTSSVQKYPQAY